MSDKFGAGRGSDTEGAGARKSRPTTNAANRQELLLDDAGRLHHMVDVVAERDKLRDALYETSRKFTLAEERADWWEKHSAELVNERNEALAALREIAQYPQPSDGRKLREIAREALA